MLEEHKVFVSKGIATKMCDKGQPEGREVMVHFVYAGCMLVTPLTHLKVTAVLLQCLACMHHDYQMYTPDQLKQLCGGVKLFIHAMRI